MDADAKRTAAAACLAFAFAAMAPVALAAPGATLVRDINPLGDSSPYGLANVSGTLFFAADDGLNGPQLWKSMGNGTAAHDLVADVRDPDLLTPVGGIALLHRR